MKDKVNVLDFLVFRGIYNFESKIEVPRKYESLLAFLRDHGVILVSSWCIRFTFKVAVVGSVMEVVEEIQWEGNPKAMDDLVAAFIAVAKRLEVEHELSPDISST